MGDFSRSGGPVRPGLVKYERPESFRYTPPVSGGQSLRSHDGGQGHTQGQDLVMYINRVTAIWGDLESLSTLPIQHLPGPSITALEKTLAKLLECHTFSATISKEHDHLAKANRSLSQEKEVLINDVRDREVIIQQLQSSLKAFRDSPRTGVALQTHSRQGSDGLRRAPNVSPRPSSSTGMDLLTLRERVAELEEQLNDQQTESIGRMSPEKELERIDDIQAQYASLETFGLNQMKLVVDHVGKQLMEEDKFKVIYGVLVVAIERSNDMLTSLKTAIRKLIDHPDRYLMVAPPGDEGGNDKPLEYRSSLIVRENVRMFENKESGLSGDPRQRIRITQERISRVYQYIRELMNDTVDSCKLSTLEKEVTEAMKAEYGALIHGSLWFDSKFTRFLAECCRLAWKISLTDRDIVLQSAPFEAYNEKRHHAYRSEATPRSRVEYFAWPVLIDNDSRYVLHKGRARFS